MEKEEYGDDDEDEDDMESLTSIFFDMLSTEIINLEQYGQSLSSKQDNTNQTKKDDPKKQTTQEEKSDKSTKRKPSPFFTSFQMTEGKCHWCKENDSDHSLVTCSKLDAIQNLDVLKICNKFKLCKNCFLTNHLAKDCPSEDRCHCGRKHHKKLHNILTSKKESKN